VIDEYPGKKDLRIRVVLDLADFVGEIYIMVEILKTPSPGAYHSGVRVITCQLQRDNPKAKLTASIPVADKIRGQLPTGVEEALMVDEVGRILEGLTSNFFAVKGGELWTNEEGVLSGITRLLVLDEAVRIELPVNFRSITITEIHDLEEAFITSSSRGILPVKQIDEVRVGDRKPVSPGQSVCPGQSVWPGQPGPITVRLMDCLEDRIRNELLEI
jgi:branched-chain amino acid aminotransferase